MKKLLITILTLSVLASCENTAEKQNNTEANSETTSNDLKIEVETDVSVEQSFVEESEIKIPNSLFQPENLGYILQVTDSEMFKNGELDYTWTQPISFRPDGWETDFVYAQVDFIKGEVTSTAFVIFYPQIDGFLDEKGTLNSEVYQIMQEEDHPCVVCKMESITIEQPADVDYPVIKGVFVDRVDESKKIIKYMDYNFQEMFVYWTDKYNYENNADIDETSENDKNGYSKSDLVGIWFQPHFAVRTFELFDNNEVKFYTGAIENDEEISISGVWDFANKDHKEIVIVFEKGKKVDLEMPLKLNGGLNKTSFMLSNDSEKFAKTFD